MGLICMSVVHILSSQRQHSGLKAVCDRTTQSLFASSCVCGVNEKKKSLLRTLIRPCSLSKYAFYFCGKQKLALGESAWGTYARQTEPVTFTRLLRSKWNFRDSVDVEDKTIPILATRTQRWAASNCEWMIHVQYFQPEICWLFVFLKSAVQTTPTKWLLKPWQIHLQV